MVLIVHASKDERGKYSGGVAGDQTGKEVCARGWYNRPWSHVLRFIDTRMQDNVARAMEKAAENSCVGYNQGNRNSLLYYARQVDYDLSRVKTPCNTDCSALVSVACISAGIPEHILYRGGNCSTTKNIRSRLKATGKVLVYTDKEFTTKPDKLIRGDILLYEGHHVAVVVESDTNKKSVTEIANEVLQGKWGNGQDRKNRLTQAGYNYSEVQAEVNRISRG